jgi:hypothetical protein
MTSVRTLLGLLALLGGAADSKYLQRDLERVAADWLAVAPPDLAEALDPLCDLRARTLRVAIVRTDDVAAKHGPGPEGIAKLVAAVKPKYLLLAGDADTVPTFLRRSAYTSEKFASDPDLATDHLFGAVTGRLPADTAGELSDMAAKIVEYETAARPGPWRRKVAFVTGEGGFGPLIDAILESQFSAVVTNNLPPGYDVEMAYAKPSSMYSWYPPKFNEKALDLLNEGSLFYAYVGHGMRSCFDDVRWNGFAYPILEAKDAKKVDVRNGLPVMVVIACNTGEYDSKLGDCIGETLFKRRRGPVAFIGGTRVTQPYGNALLGHHLVEQIFHARARTLGDAFWTAKGVVSGEDGSTLRKQADAIAGLVQGFGSLEAMRRDVVLHYNLLGDPALALPLPADEIRLLPRGMPGPGRLFTITGAARNGPVELTFECPRNRFHHPVDLAGDTVEAQLTRRYRNANDKVVARASATARDGAFEAELELPKDLKPGRYVLKASQDAAIGAIDVEIREP